MERKFYKPNGRTLVEWVARAIFEVEQMDILGHRPSVQWVDTGWENKSGEAYAAIKAYEQWAQANAGVK